MPNLKEIFISTRPWSFTMSFISVTVGTLIAAEQGPLHWGYYALVVVGIICFHAAANVLNDVCDTHYEVDGPEAPTAHYRPHPIFTGMFTRKQLFIEAVILFLLTIGIGVTLALLRTLLVLWIGLVGFFASVFYTAGPVKYKYRSLGEISVFLMWGPLMFEGAYAVQRQTLSLKALYLSIPFGLLVALVLLADNMRDIEYDRKQGVKTLSIYLGVKKSFFLYAFLILGAYLSMIGMVIGGIISPWCLLVLLSLPQAVGLLRTFSRQIPEAADAVTSQLDMAFGILLIVSLGAQALFPL